MANCLIHRLPSLTGNATASDVKAGKTFYSNSLAKKTGTFNPTYTIVTIEPWTDGTYYRGLAYLVADTSRSTYTYNNSYSSTISSIGGLIKTTDGAGDGVKVTALAPLYYNKTLYSTGETITGFAYQYGNSAKQIYTFFSAL